MKFNNFFLKWYFPAFITVLMMVISTYLNETEYYSVLPTDTTYAFFIPALVGMFTLAFADIKFMKGWYVFASGYLIILIPIIFSTTRGASPIGIESQSSLSIVCGVIFAVSTGLSVLIYKVRNKNNKVI